ncbi:MAG: GNAT family N-acetyltransferase [Oscillibacter sp.]
MSQSNIQYRAIQPSDYKALQKIICATWNYERFCSPKTAAKLARLFLSSCLKNQTYTCVALNGGEPVGVIMGKNERTHRPPMRYTLRQIGSILAMLAGREGREVLRNFDGFDQINKSLYGENTRKFGGEVAFFAVRSDQRGTGIGKELFARVQGYMKSQDISDFYLFTDSTCNYGFYNHQGMEPVCKRTYRIKAYNNQETSFFLYGSRPAEG